MNKQQLLFFCTSIILVTANWSTEQSSVDEPKNRKHRVNFFGTLYTRNGKTLSVDNISIGGLFKSIKVYEAQQNTQPQLSSDPTKGIKVKLDLSEIASIRTIQPDTVRFYQAKSGARKTEYVEIEVTPTDSSAAQANRYLIETKRTLQCDEISPGGPLETEVPFTALDHLDIKGFKKRESITTKNIENNKLETKDCECTIKTSQARPDAPLQPEQTPKAADCEQECPSDCPPEEPVEPTYGVRAT